MYSSRYALPPVGEKLIVYKLAAGTFGDARSTRLALEDLKQRLGLSMLFVTHDLRVAAQICDSVVVMQAGRVVEAGPTAEVFAHPQAAYTRELLAAIPGRAWSGRERPEIHHQELLT